GDGGLGLLAFAGQRVLALVRRRRAGGPVGAVGRQALQAPGAAVALAPLDIERRPAGGLVGAGFARQSARDLQRLAGLGAVVEAGELGLGRLRLAGELGALGLEAADHLVQRLGPRIAPRPFALQRLDRLARGLQRG